MKRLLLIASKSGYQTAQFAAAARRQNVELILTTDRCHQLKDPWGDQALPLDFRQPSFTGLPQADGIVAVGDQPAVIAAQAAERIGLRFHPYDAVQLCRDKFAMRERFRLADMLVPRFERISKPIKTDLLYPSVLKPLSLSASRGVIRVNSEAEFLEAFHRITKMVPGEDLQLEEFIPGREFAIEGIVTDGRLKVLTIFDKPDPLDGPFFEETIYASPSREPVEIQNAIEETVRRAVTALGLSNGPIHAECRVNERGVWMLEVAARPIGGLCARALRFESGRTLEEIIVRHALGESVLDERVATGGSAVMMIPIPKSGIYAGVQGVDEAAKIAAAVEITAAPGQHLQALPEGASYLGFLFAYESTALVAEQTVRAAHAKLMFEIQESLAVL